MKNKITVFDEKYINTFAKQIDTQYVDNAYEYVCNILNTAIDELCKKRPIIADYETEIVNECATFSENSKSSLDIFLSIKSPQLELSVLKLNNNILKKVNLRFKNAWHATMKPKNKRRWFNFFKKDKKKKDDEISNKNLTINNDKYNIINFEVDLVSEMAKNLTEQTQLYVNNYGITILGEEEIGMNVNIYVTFQNGEELKIFNSNEYRLTTIDFGSRMQNIESKNNATNYAFRTILRIFNGMFANLMNYKLNQIFIESILYNCPDELFKGTTYQAFLKIVNYINISNYQNFKSITNSNLNIFDDNLVTISYYEFNKFIKLMAKLI